VSDKNKSWLLFLLGLFSLTQISLIGYIGISEIVCYVVAPVVFCRRLDLFRWLKLMPYFGFVTLWAAFALITDGLIHHKEAEILLKGVAPVYSLFAVSVCTVILLHDRFPRLSWYIVGAALSYVLSTVVFQRGSAIASPALDEAGGSAMNAVMSYKLYWLSLLAIFTQLPVQIRFRTIPLSVSVGLVLVSAVFALFGGARSMFLVLLVSCGFLMMGRGVRSHVYRPRLRSVVPLAVFMVLMSLIAQSTYTYGVKKGWLGWEEQQKYEGQTKIGTSGLALLMSGRGDFWIGLSAAWDKPWFGHGSRALDWDGYEERYVEKYGDDRDIWNMKRRIRLGISTLPAHSYIISAWVWHGMGGLVFWLYVLYLCYKTMTVWMWYMPDQFGWFVTMLPPLVWAILFSPFSDRVGVSVLIVAMLLSRNVTEGVMSGQRREVVRRRGDLIAQR